DHLRQLRPALAQGHSWDCTRRRGSAGADRLAGAARPVRSRTPRNRDRLCRRDRRRRGAGAGSAEQSRAHGARARPTQVSSGGRRRRIDPAGRARHLSMSVLALAGGIGGAKLALGLYRILPPGALTVVANTGDDFEHLGVSISPDIDTLLYTLAGID